MAWQRVAALAWLVGAMTLGAQDMPLLPDVLMDLCGASDFTATPAHPCQYRVFGLAMAWSQCSNAHGKNVQAFQQCFGGCVAEDLCEKACEQLGRHCLEECAVLTRCLEQGLEGAEGAASARDSARRCLLGGPAAALLAARRPVFRGRGRRGHHQLLAASAKDHVLNPPAEGLAMLPGTSNCTCDDTGVIDGISTGSVGCSVHPDEPESGGELACFVAGGGHCPGATPSARFPGLFWVSCGRAADDLQKLFPPGCELLAKQLPLVEVPGQPSLEPPPPDPAALVAPQPGTSVNSTGAAAEWSPTPAGGLAGPEPAGLATRGPLEDFAAEVAERAAPLAESWHAARGDVFLRPQAPLPPGPLLPPGLTGPAW